MITINEWTILSAIQQTEWLECNLPVNPSLINKRKSVAGVGINDATYISQPTIGGGLRVRCPAYNTWIAIINRGHSSTFKRKHPSYSTATVDDAWHSFMSFRSWWIGNYVDGWQLDKDLLIDGNKSYGPGKCLYVPNWVNTIIEYGESINPDLPIGVCKNKSGRMPYQATVSINGRTKHLGRFNNPLDAHKAYVSAKLNHIDSVADELNAIDQRLYHAIRGQVVSRSLSEVSYG